MKAASVKIGPEFFALAKNDYANWHWAWAREICQNSFDAHRCNKIDVTIEAKGNDTLVTVRNNGAPMTEDVLVNKFLTLGGSGKNFQGTVGGFGKAKELLVYCHKGWSIRTGTLLVEGCGGDYELHDNLEDFHGTETTVLMSGDVRCPLIMQFRLFIELSQWGGTFNFMGLESDEDDAERNPIAVTGRTIKGARRKDLEFGTIYTNNSAQGRMLVRIGGIPMFTKPIRYKGQVLVELSGESNKVLTSNRDGLIYNAQCELDKFIAEIAVNVKSAFKDNAKLIVKTRYAGYKLAGMVSKGETMSDDEMKESLPGDLVLAARIADATTGAKEAPAVTVAEVQRVFRPEFHVRDEIGGKIPSWHLPAGFSDNSKRLVSNWIALLVELAVLTKSQDAFSVGFVFDPDCEGLFVQEGGEKIIFVNPVEIIEKDGKSRQLKTRWSFNAAGNWKLLALAAHEFTHFLGFSSHDEDFSSKFTDLVALVLANRTRFSRHFSAPVAWPE